MKWFDVRDRLPDKDEVVLCAVEHIDGEIYTEIRWIPNDEVIHPDENGFSLYSNSEKQVLAWMPLPEYKKNK